MRLRWRREGRWIVHGALVDRCRSSVAQSLIEHGRDRVRSLRPPGTYAVEAIEFRAAGEGERRLNQTTLRRDVPWRAAAVGSLRAEILGTVVRRIELDIIPP